MIDDTGLGGGLLGAHVTERSDQVTARSQTRIALKPRQSKISNPEMPVLVKQ